MVTVIAGMRYAGYRMSAICAYKNLDIKLKKTKKALEKALEKALDKALEKTLEKTLPGG